jgi:hypothetical protein
MAKRAKLGQGTQHGTRITRLSLVDRIPAAHAVHTVDASSTIRRKRSGRACSGHRRPKSNAYPRGMGTAKPPVGPPAFPEASVRPPEKNTSPQAGRPRRSVTSLRPVVRHPEWGLHDDVSHAPSPKPRPPEWSVYVDVSHAPFPKPRHPERTRGLAAASRTSCSAGGPRSRDRREARWRKASLAGGTR